VTLETLKKYRKTFQMYACTIALIVYSFTDLLTDFNGNEWAYVALSGLAGFTAMQTVKEKQYNNDYEDLMGGN